MKRLGFIIIGRNEGARLQACLASVPWSLGTVVYVDSGSTDDSVAMARAAGALIVELDPGRPFTAARARNEGAAALAAAGHCPDYLQFIDGDCTLVQGWVEAAVRHLDTTPEAAVACGRRRERHPENSVYNRLCDREWNTPVGEARSCGGDALVRRRAFDAVGGFRESLIAGEEPELCIRLRADGWTVWRIDAEMTLHDAAMTRLGQWWKRTRRAGFAEAEGAALHGRSPDRRGIARTRRALIWGLMLPVCAGLGGLVTPWALCLLLTYPLQIARLAWQQGGQREDWEAAFFLTLAKVPEALGAVEYAFNRYRPQRRIQVIEYK